MRDLKGLVPFVVDIIQRSKVDLSTYQLKELFYNQYHISLSTRDIRYIIDVAMNENNHIFKYKHPNRRLSYKWL
jgi:hypothetical protein